MNDMNWSCYYLENGELCGKFEPCKKRKDIFTNGVGVDKR